MKEYTHEEYTHEEFEEFARIAFYKGREIDGYDEYGKPTFKRPTFNGFLREIEDLPQPKCGCPKGICVGHNSSFNRERRDIHENIIELLCYKTGVHENDVTLEAHMKNDLGLNSLDIIEFSMELEKEYNFIFDDKTADEFQGWTINQLINHIVKDKE